jgi:hypothetical protein
MMILEYAQDLYTGTEGVLYLVARCMQALNNTPKINGRNHEEAY